MPKVPRSNKRSQLTGVRTTVLDPYRKHKAQTRVASSGTEVVTRQLRSVRIETHIVRREPLPDLNAALPAVSYSNGCRELFESLKETSIQEESRRFKEPQWLSQIDIERYSLAFPPELRVHSYLLSSHLHTLYVTGLIDNLGPEASLKLQLVEYLESTEAGRIYLITINKDHILRRYFRHLDEANTKKYLIGRIWFAVRLAAELDTEFGDPHLGYWQQYCFECRNGTTFGNTLCHCAHNTHINCSALESDTG